LNRIVDNRLKILNFDQIDFIKQKKTLFSCNGKQKVKLLHDKTRPHVAKTVRERIENLGREVLPHPAYSPDLAPSDFQLFRSMQHFFQEKIYTEVESIKKDLDSYFSSRPEGFYKSEIEPMPERWEKVTLNDGNYFDD
jgi:[histone H3]-lysine36 N-dimethyltransferase SETMAR